MIHPTAIITPGADLDSGVTVGAYAVIGEHVKIGAGTVVGPHAVIEGRTEIGRDNQIFQFASIGAIPQDLKFHGGRDDSENRRSEPDPRVCHHSSRDRRWWRGNCCR